MGKLTSGFGGFFGSKQEAKELRDYNEITLLFAGGLTFTEIKEIELLGQKLKDTGRKLKIVTNGFYHKYDTFHWF